MTITLHQFMAYCKRHNLNSVVISASYRMHNDECIGVYTELSQNAPEKYESYHEDVHTYDVVRSLSLTDAYRDLQFGFVTPEELVQAHMRSLMPKRAVFSNDFNKLPF